MQPQKPPDSTTMNTRPLFIPVILGTVRKGRASENVANFVCGELQKGEGVETELIDISDLQFPADDAGEQIKNKTFSETCERADGFVIVAPEYNHGWNAKARARFELERVHT